MKKIKLIILSLFVFQATVFCQTITWVKNLGNNGHDMETRITFDNINRLMYVHSISDALTIGGTNFLPGELGIGEINKLAGVYTSLFKNTGSGYLTTGLKVDNTNYLKGIFNPTGNGLNIAGTTYNYGKVMTSIINTTGVFINPTFFNPPCYFFDYDVFDFSITANGAMYISGKSMIPSANFSAVPDIGSTMKGSDYYNYVSKTIGNPPVTTSILCNYSGSSMSIGSKQQVRVTTNNNNLYIYGIPSVISGITGTLFKIDSNDSLFWSHNDGDSISKTIIDNNQNVYVLGKYNGTLTIGNTVTNNSGVENYFIARYDSQGNGIWVKDITQDYSLTDGSIYTDGLQIFYSSSFTAPVNFPNQTMQSNGGSDILISAFDVNGNFEWAKQIGGIYNDDPVELKFDAAHCLYLNCVINTGSAPGTLDTCYFDTTPVITNGFSNCIAKMSVPLPTSIEESVLTPVLTSVKNPVHDNLIFSMSSDFKTVNVQLADVTGRLVYQNKFLNYPSGEQVGIKTSGISKGIYILNVRLDGKMETFKVVKN